MGSGKWTSASYNTVSNTRGYLTASNASEVFTRVEVDRLMDPKGVEVRESRDSAEHPESLAVILMLDQTGSMNRIPFLFVKEGMPHMMEGILGAGIQHPQILFGAIGDHLTGEPAPLQIGQFESSAELMDRWLGDVYMVGMGGGNNCESYLLAWYFAGYRTSIDCFEKRGEKGFLFTIGDEKTHDSVTSDSLKKLFGPGQFENIYSAQELLAKAQEKYHVYHLHVNEGGYRDNQEVLGSWRSMLGENLIIVNDYKELPTIIAETIANVQKSHATSTFRTDKIEVDEML